MKETQNLLDMLATTSEEEMNTRQRYEPHGWEDLFVPIQYGGGKRGKQEMAPTFDEEDGKEEKIYNLRESISAFKTKTMKDFEDVKVLTDVVDIINTTEETMETSPKNIFYSFTEGLTHDELAFLSKVPNIKSKDALVKCDAVKRVIFREYLVPLKRIGVAIQEAQTALKLTTDLVLTCQFASGDGKIPWTSAYQDFILSQIKGEKPQPERYNIAVNTHFRDDNDEDDPMGDLVEAFGGMSAGNDTAGEEKKKGKGKGKKKKETQQS